MATARDTSVPTRRIMTTEPDPNAPSDRDIPDRLLDLVERGKAIEAQLQQELDRRRAAFRFRMEKRKVVFEQDIRARHDELRRKFWSYVRDARLLVVLTAPVIYAMIIPLVLLDLFVMLYQTVCFPVYGIEKVRRSDYIIFDHQYLHYLNGIEKLNCLYCSYGNGLIAFVREIAGRTERHWCPIKHARRMTDPHRHYLHFSEYGDAVAYQARLTAARENSAKTP